MPVDEMAEHERRMARQQFYLWARRLPYLLLLTAPILIGLLRVEAGRQTEIAEKSKSVSDYEHRIAETRDAIAKAEAETISCRAKTLRVQEEYDAMQVSLEDLRKRTQIMDRAAASCKKLEEAMCALLKAEAVYRSRQEQR